MTLNAFCTAVYKRKHPITSQTKFVQNLFRATGGTYEVSDSYGPKLFKREKPLGDERQQFPDPINRTSVYGFLEEHLTPPPDQRKRRNLADRIIDVAQALNMPNPEEVVSGTFIWALTDWLNDIIHHPEVEQTFNNYYYHRKKGHNPSQLSSRIPYYSGDKVDLIHSISTPGDTPHFYQPLRHKWVFRNAGTVAWEGRYLRCENPRDCGIRPSQSIIAIPDTSPTSKVFITIEADFQARGIEGQTTSHWRMRDKEDNNCFPGRDSLFDVKATVINLNPHENKDR